MTTSKQICITLLSAAGSVFASWSPVAPVVLPAGSSARPLALLLTPRALVSGFSAGAPLMPALLPSLLFLAVFRAVFAGAVSTAALLATPSSIGRDGTVGLPAPLS